MPHAHNGAPRLLGCSCCLLLVELPQALLVGSDLEGMELDESAGTQHMVRMRAESMVLQTERQGIVIAGLLPHAVAPEVRGLDISIRSANHTAELANECQVCRIFDGLYSLVARSAGWLECLVSAHASIIAQGFSGCQEKSACESRARVIMFKHGDEKEECRGAGSREIAK